MKRTTLVPILAARLMPPLSVWAACLRNREARRTLQYVCGTRCRPAACLRAGPVRRCSCAHPVVGLLLEERGSRAWQLSNPCLRAEPCAWCLVPGCVSGGQHEGCAQLGHNISFCAPGL